MFDTICQMIPRDPDLPRRAWRLGVLQRVLEGTLYDVLSFEFHQERSASGEYIPLRNRRPSVRYALPRQVVEESVALLFSEAHFPAIDAPDPLVRTTLAAMVRDCRLNSVMTEAAIRGSIGSVAVLLRILRGRIFFSVLDAIYLTPQWQPEAPDTLALVRERYKVGGAVLAGQGYEISQISADYWFMRDWDAEFETWYQPTLVGSSAEPVVDSARTVRHGLGFVPIVWIRNLPGGNDIDGSCTFQAAIDTSIEIDYQLSQAGRGLKYSSDPTLLIKEPAIGEGAIVKGAGNALVVSEHGDARLLEIGGTASAAVIDYVRTLREYALESVHGNRASADRVSAAQSGRALELMNQGLIWLTDNLRVSYGESGLLQLARMVLRAAAIYPIMIAGAPAPPMPPETPLSLIWPPWYPPTAGDRVQEAQALVSLLNSGLISRESAVKSIAAAYDISDIHGEISRIAQDEREQQ